MPLALDGTHTLRIPFGGGSPELAILDWLMPGADSLEVHRELRKCETGYYAYILLLTAESTQEDLLTGSKTSANSYLMKPFDLMEAHPRLWVSQRIVKLCDQLIATKKDLLEQAALDPLTTA